MEFIVRKLNFIVTELDQSYEINSGGCCYFAYRIAYWLERYGIDYYFIIQDDKPIINEAGKHYCIQILSNGLFINKSSKYSHIKSIKRTANEILEYYNKSEWSEKYDISNNCIVDKYIDGIFNLKRI